MSQNITGDVDPLVFGQRNMNSENKPELVQPTQPTRGKRRIPKNRRKNGILNRQARMIIYNVNCYMKKEAEDGVKHLKQVHKRTAEATDTSVHTVRRILKEGSSILAKANTPDIISELDTPGKKRSRYTSNIQVSSYDEGVIKRCIHNFHITEKVLPSMLKLRDKLANDIKFQGSERSLRRIINRLGFRWKRTENNKKLLIEKSDIRFKRIEFLQKLAKYKQDGRSIIYTGETFIDTPINKIDDQGHKLVTKKQRIVIVHAASEVGFIPNALLIFTTNITNAKTGEVDILSYENYKRWLHTKLLPNLPNNSVVVIGNASYHNKQYDPAPTSNAKIIDMQTWLTERHIYYTEDMLKPQLYNLIKSYKKQENTYSINQLLAESNHEVLRLPPYHPDLNPIEMAWTAIRWYVDKHNTWCTDEVTELIKEKVASLGPSEWTLLGNKVKEIEDEYRRSDHVVDMLTEKFVIQVNDDDSGSDAESPSASCDDASDDEVIMPNSSNDDDEVIVPNTSHCVSNDDDEVIMPNSSHCVSNDDDEAIMPNSSHCVSNDDDEVIMPNSSHCVTNNDDDLVKAFSFPLYP